MSTAESSDDPDEPDTLRGCGSLPLTHPRSPLAPRGEAALRSPEDRERDNPSARRELHSLPGGGAGGRPTLSRVAPSPGGATSDRLFTRPFVRLLGMQAAYGFSFSMFFLLPKYLATAGASPSQIGFVMAGFGVACVLTIPFLPAIIGAFGRRGALMAATISLAVAGAAFAAIAPVGAGAIFLRASEGVTWTIMFSTALTLTAEMAPLGRLAQAIGLAGAAGLIMNAVAPAIGEPIADRFGYRPVFLLAAAAALLASALARRLPKSQPSDIERVPAPAPANIAPERAGRSGLYVVFALAGLAFSVLFTFLAPYALGHGVRVISSFFIAYTASALVLRVLGGRLSDRLGHRTIATYALLLYGLVVASTGLLGPHRLALLGIGFGLAHGAAFPALMALLISGASARKRPRVLAMANGAMSVGISAVFPAGAVVARLGYPTLFAIAGGLVATSSLLIRKRRA